MGLWSTKADFSMAFWTAIIGGNHLKFSIPNH